MKLETNCPDCHQPITAKLDDTTSEIEAQAIATRLYCIPCAIERTLQITKDSNYETEEKP